MKLFYVVCNYILKLHSTLRRRIICNAAIVILYLSVDIRWTIQIYLENNPFWQSSHSALFQFMLWNTWSIIGQEKINHITLYFEVLGNCFISCTICTLNLSKIYTQNTHNKDEVKKNPNNLLPWNKCWIFVGRFLVLKNKIVLI